MARDWNRVVQDLSRSNEVFVTKDGDVETAPEAQENATREERREGVVQPRRKLKPDVFGCVLRAHEEAEPTVAVAPEVIAEMENEAAKALKKGVETGGIGLGSKPRSIERLILSGPDARRTSTSFQLDPAYLQPLLDRAMSEGLDLTSVWHVHPAGCESLSNTDIATAKRILADPDYGLDELILPLTVPMNGALRTTFYFIGRGDAGPTEARVVAPDKRKDVSIAKSAAPEQATRAAGRLAHDIAAFTKAGWVASLRRLGGGDFTLHVANGSAALALMLPEEFPLNPPEVISLGDRPFQIPFAELPETDRWSSRRSLLVVAEQALAAIERRRAPMRRGFFASLARAFGGAPRVDLPRSHS